MIGPVGRMLEEQVRGPVVREVFCHLAGSAGASRADVARHGRVEGVAADDVMQMRGRVGAGLDDGVEALDCEGGAGEAEAGVHERAKRDE